MFFSNNDIGKCLRLYLLIECLQVNRMYVTSFWFHSKLVLEKAKKPASYELAIHTVEIVLWIFSNEILTDFISPSSLKQQRSVLSEKLYVK